MKWFRRQPKPIYWWGYEKRWVKELRNWARAKPPSAKKDALWGWRREGKILAERFHDEVRPEGEPRLCAYCDGPLGETSPETIDHFIPESLHLRLGVFWHNLFPSCALCNSTYKKARWSPELLRPDFPEIESCFDFDPESGKLRPAPELDDARKQRVEKTIEILGLNQGARPHARRQRWRQAENAWKTMDSLSMTEDILLGPYRFVAERLHRAKMLEPFLLP